MPETHEHQRSLVELEIEHSYLDVIEQISQIRAVARFGGESEKGLYQKYYYSINKIYGLTCNEIEITKNAEEESKDLFAWIVMDLPKDTGRWILDGIELFRRYDQALHSCGIIVLPHRVR